MNKALPQLCLLFTCVASLSSGLAWSDTPVNQNQVASPERVVNQHNNYRYEYFAKRWQQGSHLVLARSQDLMVEEMSGSVPRSADAPPAVPLAKSVPAPIAASASLAAAIPVAVPARWAVMPVGTAEKLAVVQVTPMHASTINPYLVNAVAFNQMGSTTIDVPMSINLTAPNFNLSGDLGHLYRDIRRSLPSIPPLADESILPTLKKVYPTGDKPLYVLTFKCPTELVGIVPPPTKVLHWLVSSGMEAINSTNLLPFNMQQVCQ